VRNARIGLRVNTFRRKSPTLPGPRDEGFKSFEPWRDALIEQEASERHKLGRKIAMEEDWLRYGVTARRTRNQRRLAELHALRRKRKAFRTPTPYVWRSPQRLRWLHYLAE
jgi:ATPase subunit of ABC transporter with duplicated ATPase domains